MNRRDILIAASSSLTAALAGPANSAEPLKQRLLENVWLSNGFTAILVTHDVAEAVALGDRIVLIDHGAIAADIPVALPRPRQRGSAEFARVEAAILERLLTSVD